MHLPCLRRPGLGLLGVAFFLSGPAGLAAEPRRTRTIEVVPGAVMEFVWIPPGTFPRGSPDFEAGRDRDEGPVQEVELTRGFFLGVREVTQAQWHAVLGTQPAVFRRGEEAPRRPVESVSWEDCQRFIAALRPPGPGRFRLPTEAEWEYAARAGTTTRFPWGDDPQYQELARHAWFYSLAEGRSHPVGLKPANRLRHPPDSRRTNLGLRLVWEPR